MGRVKAWDVARPVAERFTVARRRTLSEKLLRLVDGNGFQQEGQSWQGKESSTNLGLR